MLFFTPFLFALLALAGLSTALPLYDSFHRQKHHGTATFPAINERNTGFDEEGSCGLKGGPAGRVAVSATFFNSVPGVKPGDDPTKNPLCGKELSIKCPKTGRTLSSATVVGSDPSLEGDNILLDYYASSQLDDNAKDSAMEVEWHVAYWDTYEA
ncbi:hypothetical protein BC835DRAFT_1347192 [Cytidiella melzeri]|nr:hypothetical protein BC835DRAFT_1347192 [Cytidiella melzeri]